MKRTLELGLAGAALVTLVTASASATVMIEYALEELVGGADAVVHATVVQSRVRMVLDGEGGMAPETLTTLRVHEWIAGPGGATVELRELGGVYPGGGLRYDGTPEYAVGEEVVVFLERRHEAPHDLRTLGMAQGKFIVRQGLGGVPSTVRRDLTGIAFARWRDGVQTVVHPCDGATSARCEQPGMDLHGFLDYVRRVRRDLRGAQ
ncbi:MAG: hypothetical protein KF729_07155 [Sandaracinaceae bacterium]|nr:hypothetical protein [Sandaracinaceae bacterium]